MHAPILEHGGISLDEQISESLAAHYVPHKDFLASRKLNLLVLRRQDFHISPSFRLVLSRFLR